MENNQIDKKRVWQRIGIIFVLLTLLIGPNFGPIPTMLSKNANIETSVLALLFSFIIGFTIILVIVKQFNKNISFKEMLKSFGWAAPTRTGAVIAGAILGLLWGFMFMSGILQFDPDTNLAQITGLRILAALIAASGALMEDFITRSFIMNQLQSINVSKWLQAILSALIFAVYHTIWGFNIYSFIFSVIYGLMLSGLFLWGKRSLTPVLLGHSLAVLISEPFATMMIFLAARM